MTVNPEHNNTIGTPIAHHDECCDNTKTLVSEENTSTSLTAASSPPVIDEFSEIHVRNYASALHHHHHEEHDDDAHPHHHIMHDQHDPRYLNKMHPEDRHAYKKLLRGNRAFVAKKLNEEGPEYFTRKAQTQQPKFLVIGCSDSRVHPDQVTGTKPGDIFIHRNVANLVVNTDLNLMSVLQYAVEVLKVKHVIVLGHYNCGGVKASMEQTHHGLIDKWLRSIKDVQRLHFDKLNAVEDYDERVKLLTRLNVQEQTLNLCKTSIIQKAWARGQNVHVHGWVYDLREGLMNDLKIEEKLWREIAPIYGLRFPEVEREEEYEAMLRREKDLALLQKNATDDACCRPSEGDASC